MNSPWYLPRVPEPEEMDSADEVQVYNSAAAEAHLDRIDNTFVAHLGRLLHTATRLRLPALDRDHHRHGPRLLGRRVGRSGPPGAPAAVPFASTFKDRPGRPGRKERVVPERTGSRR